MVLELSDFTLIVHTRILACKFSRPSLLPPFYSFTIFATGEHVRRLKKPYINANLQTLVKSPLPYIYRETYQNNLPKTV